MHGHRLGLEDHVRIAADILLLGEGCAAIGDAEGVADRQQFHGRIGGAAAKLLPGRGVVLRTSRQFDARRTQQMHGHRRRLEDYVRIAVDILLLGEGRATIGDAEGVADRQQFYGRIGGAAAELLPGRGVVLRTPRQFGARRTQQMHGHRLGLEDHARIAADILLLGEGRAAVGDAEGEFALCQGNACDECSVGIRLTRDGLPRSFIVLSLTARQSGTAALEEFDNRCGRNDSDIERCAALVPAASIAVQVTKVVPSGNREPEVGAHDTRGEGSRESLAVGSA